MTTDPGPLSHAEEQARVSIDFFERLVVVTLAEFVAAEAKFEFIPSEVNRAALKLASMSHHLHLSNLNNSKTVMEFHRKKRLG